MPNLLDRIRAIFIRAEPAQPNTLALTQPPARPTQLLGRFKAETERAEIVKRCRDMYAQDPRAKKMLRVLARDLVKGGFVLKTGDARAMEVAEAMRARLDLDQRLDDWVRLTARDGDSFLEIGVTSSLEIAEITRKPTLQMHRNTDEFDRFADPTRAFYWTDEIYTALNPDDGNVTWFAEWQVIHARWEHDEGSRYGTPMLASGTGAWKKVQEGELDIAVRRKTRAGLKYLHVVEGASEPELEAYKERNKDALDNPFAAVADYFTNKAGSISVLQGDARLGEIADVQHQIATWFTAGEVPMELVAYGENLNRDVLQEKKDEYDETLEGLRDWVTAQLVKPLLERQWLLAGIWPGGLDYSIEWRSKKLLTPADVRDVSEAAMRLRILGVPEPVIWTILGHFLPGINVDELMAPTEDQEGDVERIANTLTSLRGGVA